jgi:hypothetical protein
MLTREQVEERALFIMPSAKLSWKDADELCVENGAARWSAWFDLSVATLDDIGEFCRSMTVLHGGAMKANGDMVTLSTALNFGERFAPEGPGV